MVKLMAAGIGMGWGPCLAISGPVLLPYIAATKDNWREGLKASAAFSLGRLIALAILGGLASVAFASINRLFPPFRSGYLYLVMAVFIIFIGVLVLMGKGFKAPFHLVLQEQILEKGISSILLIGFLIGILPCATLVAILTYIACTVTNPIHGAIYAISFGVGTIIPLLLLGPLTGFLPEKIFKSARHLRIFRGVCGGILILFGLQLLYSTWHLLQSF